MYLAVFNVVYIVDDMNAIYLFRSAFTMITRTILDEERVFVPLVPRLVS